MGGTVMGGRGSAGRSSGPRRDPGRKPTPDLIRGAFTKLIEGLDPDGYVMLADIRAALPKDLSRVEVDAALMQMFDDPNVTLIPESNQKVLTQQQRDAAISIGNQDNHLIGIRTPLDPGAHDRIVAGGVAAATDADLAMAQRDRRTRSALYDEIRAEVRRRKST